jgi:hypothetical protein
MIFAEIKDGVVVNVSVWDSDPKIEGLVDISNVENVSIGWGYVDGEFIDPAIENPLYPYDIIPNTEL